MIGVSIALAIWTVGLQMVERKYKKRDMAVGGESLSEHAEKDIGEAQKV